jgi:hypothetical protein
MSPVEALLGDLDVDVSREEAISALVEHSADELIGASDVERADWTAEEAASIEELKPFFASDTWVHRKSATRMAKHAPADAEIGIAAYKSRKTLQANVTLDDGRIEDAQLTGDLYIRPQATVTSPGALEHLERAIISLEATDQARLEAAINDTFERYDVEAPGIEPEHFARPVTRAADNSVPVGEYLAGE